MSDDTSPGWDAIDAALKPLYGSQEPRHLATVIKHMMGGPDPLDGISIYRAHNDSHWHYVSYGMSELYSKTWEDKEFSGCGFEFTLRLTRYPNEDEPPIWPASLLQNMARYVFQTGNLFDDGHHLDCNGPIALETETKLDSLLFVHDPELPEINTPHGKLKFLQVVGITSDERQAVVRWNSAGIKKLFSEIDPLFLTKLDRTSILNDESVRCRYLKSSADEGSNTAALYVTSLDISRMRTSAGEVELVLGARVIEDFIELIQGRLFHGRSLVLSGADRTIELIPESTFDAIVNKKKSELKLPKNLCEEVCQILKPQRGLYSFKATDALRIRVEPSEIKDAQGKVVEVIG